LKWIEENPNAEADAYEAEKKKLEGTCMPIMAKIYQQGGAPGGPGGAAPGGAPGGGPTVEDYDVD